MGNGKHGRKRPTQHGEGVRALEIRREGHDEAEGGKGRAQPGAQAEQERGCKARLGHQFAEGAERGLHAAKGRQIPECRQKCPCQPGRDGAEHERDCRGGCQAQKRPRASRTRRHCVP